MTTLSYTYNLTNGTTADANEVMGNFNSVASVMNGSIDTANINLGISPLWTGTHQFDPGKLKLEGAGAGVAAFQYANSSQNVNVTYPDNGATGYSVATPSHINPVVSNFKISLSSGTLTVDGINATWSSTSPGVVHTQFGANDRVMSFTSAITFQDSSHGVDSDFVGSGTMSWGTTAAVAWGSAMPILIGACTDGTTPILVMARIPVATTGASTNIGYKDVAASSASQNNVIAMTTTDVTSSHANLPIIWVGSLRVVKTAGDDWTFQTLDTLDGVGHFENYGKRNFVFPISQNGAASGKYFKDNGGTAPVFTNNLNLYTISMDGKVVYKFRYEGDGGTDGATGVNLQLAAPLATADTGATDFFRRDVASISWAAAANVNYGFMEFTPNTTTIIFFRNSTATARTSLLNSDFPNGGREVSGTILYDAVRI